MRRLAQPRYTARSTFELCIRRIQDQVLKGLLLSVADHIEEAENRYRGHGNTATFYQVIPESNVNSCVTKEQMNNVYTSHLSREGSSSRHIYDAIKVSAKNKICPLCGLRDVKTLDHYLPKSVHPVFAVTPLNLVPSCSDCNKAKASRHPSGADKQTLHPYFDDVSDELWLQATVVQSMPPAVRFHLAPPSQWSDIKQKRLAFHFKTFGLAELYSINAAQELVQIAQALLRLSSHDVRAHSLTMAESCQADELNSWRGAFYKALGDSDWFCRIGYRLIATVCQPSTP